MKPVTLLSFPRSAPCTLCQTGLTSHHANQNQQTAVTSPPTLSFYQPSCNVKLRRLKRYLLIIMFTAIHHITWRKRMQA